MPLSKSFRTLVLLLAAACAATAQEAFALRDGDRVVFYGDSITDQRLYTTFAETFVVTRFPQTQRQPSCIPAGVATA